MYCSVIERHHLPSGIQFSLRVSHFMSLGQLIVYELSKLWFMRKQFRRHNALLEEVAERTSFIRPTQENFSA
jgi:hypothetical protein